MVRSDRADAESAMAPDTVGTARPLSRSPQSTRPIGTEDESAFPAFTAWRAGRGFSREQLGRLLERAGFRGHGAAAVMRVESHGQTPRAEFLAALSLVAGIPAKRLACELFAATTPAI